MNKESYKKKNILSYDPKELSEIVSGFGEKAFRARQVFGWVTKGIESFEEMTNVPAKLISSLDQVYYTGLPDIITEQRDKDGTIKCLYEFPDFTRVESVFMRYKYGNSICISSQAGCRMGCSFCASTLNGLERNLTAGEMFGEVLKMIKLTGEDIRHIVIMGMGEPFDNYDEVSKFLRIIHDKAGYGISYRNITVSTCGLIPAIKRFAKDFPQVNLAVSLHAPNNNTRRKLMPIASSYQYNELIDACKEYTKQTGRRITFEYALIHGVNDSTEDAEELAKHLKGWLAHVNLISLNKVKEKKYEGSRSNAVVRFRDILEKNNVPVTVRRTLGSDIDAACGQLRRI